MDHVKIYKELKDNADEAYRIWQRDSSGVAWINFMTLEDIASDYAFKHEEEIWDDSGDYRVPSE